MRFLDLHFFSCNPFYSFIFLRFFYREINGNKSIFSSSEKTFNEVSLNIYICLRNGITSLTLGDKKLNTMALIFFPSLCEI